MFDMPPRAPLGSFLSLQRSYVPITRLFLGERRDSGWKDSKGERGGESRGKGRNDRQTDRGELGNGKMGVDPTKFGRKSTPLMYLDYICSLFSVGL